MNAFRYQAVMVDGRPEHGVIEAEDRRRALQLLGQRGLFPSSLESCTLENAAVVATAMDGLPASDEGLMVLVNPPAEEEEKWRGPYVKMVRDDPWGNPYQYRRPGIHHPTSFDLWSRGADGVDGGEGEGADIGNW
jgi:general secretion pathway protein G